MHVIGVKATAASSLLPLSIPSHFSAHTAQQPDHTCTHLHRTQQFAELYLPDNYQSLASIPTVFFIHGGLWVGGTVGQYATLAREWADAGEMAVVMVEYRLSVPRAGDAAVAYPGFIEDGALAYTRIYDEVLAAQVCILSNRIQRFPTVKSHYSPLKIECLLLNRMHHRPSMAPPSTSTACS